MDALIETSPSATLHRRPGPASLSFNHQPPTTYWQSCHSHSVLGWGECAYLKFKSLKLEENENRSHQSQTVPPSLPPCNDNKSSVFYQLMGTWGNGKSFLCFLSLCRRWQPNDDGVELGGRESVVWIFPSVFALVLERISDRFTGGSRFPK